jgi:hypothetical protein
MTEMERLELLDEYSEDPDAIARARSHQMFMMDMEHNRVVCFSEGRESGLFRAHSNAIKRALRENIPFSTISAITGVGAHEIELVNRKVAQEEGFEAGYTEGCADVAQKALSEGLPMHLISTLTGLTADEIEALRQ